MWSVPLRRSCAAVLAGLCSYAAVWSVRKVYAEYLADEMSLASTRAALRLTPHDPDLHLQLAYLLIPRGPADPATPSNSAVAPVPEINAAIHSAIALDPHSSQIRLEAAGLAEQRQDYPAAEAHLLSAARLDRTFNPRWQIAEFYARRKDAARFWPALRVALAASYDNVAPLLETAWNFTPTPEKFLPLELPPSVIPIRTFTGNPARAQYLDFLVSKQRLDLAASVASSLLPALAADHQSAPSLLAYCDQSLWHGQPARGLEVWNALANARFIPYPALNPDRAPSLTNPNFEKPFLQQGFDWRLSPAPGVTILQSLRDQDSPAMLRFEFSGKQVEHAELASQFVLLSPGRPYRLTVSYRIESPGAILTPDRAPGPDTGFHLRLLDPASGKPDLLAGPPLANLPGEQSQIYRFTAPSSLYRLVLAYDRALGSTRFEGAILLHRIDLAFAP